MSSTRLCIGVAALLSVSTLRAQPSPSMTLNELLSIAVQNNRDLLAVRQRVEEARGLLRQAGVRPAPTLDVGVATGRPLATVGEQQFSAGVSREFETAGKRSKRQQVAEMQLAVAEAEYNERARQLRYEILIRYADYVAFERRLGVLEELIEANRRSLDLTKARVAKGDAAVLEQNLIAVEISRLQAQRASVSGQLEAARADVSRLVGFEPGEHWTVTEQAPAPLIPPELEELRRKALDNRPDLRIASLGQEQGEALTALAEAEARPNVTVSAGYSRVTSRFDDQFGLTSSRELTQLRDRDDMLSIGVSIPLFSRKQNLGNIEASVARSRAAQLRKEYLLRSIPLEVEAAYQRVLNFRGALSTLESEALALAQTNLAVIRQAYGLGQLRLLDVLAEQRRVLDTQLASIDLQAELQKSWAELERAVGGPVQ